MVVRLPFALLLLAGLCACVDADPAPDRAATSPPAVAPARGRFEASVVTTDRARSVSLRSAGSFDRPTGRVAFVVDLTDVDPTLGVVEVVAVDGVVYVACDHLARSLGASTRWISARGSVDDVVGVAMIDPVRWLDPRSDATDVEVGDDGLVRSITMRFDSDREGGSAVVSVQYLDVGIPVRINPPPPTDVTDVTGALGG